MAVLLFDRYLSSAKQFPRTMLQLAAAAAIFIASKIEGILPHPRASRVAGLSDGAFDLGHLVAFERVMCQSLKFDLYAPTTQNFLDMFMHALPPPESPAAEYFADKVCSTTLDDLCDNLLTVNICHFAPYVIAQSASSSGLAALFCIGTPTQ